MTEPGGWRRPAVVIVGLGVLLGCSSAADLAGDRTTSPTPTTPTATPSTATPPPRALPGGWQAEALPGRLRPVVITTDGSRLVVGGGAGIGDDAEPRLLVRGGDGWEDVPLTPRTGYGEIASLVELAVAPSGRVVALGNATGGAHLMPRWTAWSGTLEAVTETPQVFETFGGPSAGGLAGVASAPVATVIGSWATSSQQLSPAVWHEDAGRWLRRTDVDAFADRGGVQALPTAVAATRTQVVVVGTETITTATSTRQTAVAWRTRDLQRWDRLALAAGARVSSGATDLACGPDACVVAGWVGDRLSAWRVDAQAVRRLRLPRVAVEAYVARPRAAYDGTCIAVAAGQESRDLVSSADGVRWRSTPVPQAKVTDLAVVSRRLYALAPAGATPLVSRDDACAR
ncbi:MULTISPECIES: hypothetical protein [Mumia]|uniref:hypothetical protein n=1 Tax=Mumia TaxID=1546255 RepID=UPI0014213511|nr:hypothetical protein [Mumia sp. ZJ1417]QMW66009.1 hypothetical protein H4N58_17965 [Mumia sp. ZJ1417]